MMLATGEITELLIKARIDRVRHREHRKRIAVRRCAHRDFGRDIAGGTRPVLDHELLAEPF
jgi:hypothetical protein